VGKVRLDLLYGQQIARVIDITFGSPSAYTWLIPTDLAIDSTYKIIITSIKNSAITDTSDASFSIQQVIPVELTSFTATSQAGKITLSWTTATEINNLGFEIERKQENKSWVRIGFKKGHGTTTALQNYQFIDDISDLQSTSLSYRLKQIDYDGSYKYSEEVLVDNPAPVDYSLQQNYPNPFNPSTKIKYSVPVQSNVEVIIYNSIGENIAELVDDLQSSGTYEVNWDASKFASGIYFYSIKAVPIEGNDIFQSVKKMILLK
jgi:hypothetical protein